jgi:uncharacterized protein (TIGR02246 family)
MVIVSTLLLAACASQPSAPAVDTDAVAQAVRDRSAEWLALAQSKSAVAIAERIFADDAASIFDGEVHYGRDAIRSEQERDFSENPDSTISWTPSVVRVAASGDLAYELGSWVWDPDGPGEKPSETGEYVTVWTHVDGTWRAAVDAGTTIKGQ